MTTPAKQKLIAKKYNAWLCKLSNFKQSKVRRYLVVILLIGFASAGYSTLKYTQAASGDYDVVSDNFERQSLGSSWTVNFGNVGIVNQSDVGLTALSGAGIVSWVGSTLNADQFSEATISPNKVSSMLTQVFVRRRSSDSARYAFHYDADPNDGLVDEWQLKYDGVPTAQVRILASNNTVSGPQNGDVLRLEVRATNPVELKGYRNGALVLSATDSAASSISNGTPGLTMRLGVGTTTTYPTAVFENWSGGSLGVASSNTNSSTPSTTTSNTNSSTPSTNNNPADSNPTDVSPKSNSQLPSSQNTNTTSDPEQQSEVATNKNSKTTLYKVLAAVFASIIVSVLIVKAYLHFKH